MKKLFFAFITLASLNLFIALKPVEMNAREIVKKAEDNLRGTTSQAEMIIRIERPTWSREMVMKSWSKGKNYAMILITEPAKEKGTVFLKREKEVWNWIPSIERVIKMPPSMMSQSWMGTDFTNDDLVKEASGADDYTHTLLGEEVKEGRMCYKIEMIPNPNAPVVWSKVMVWIDKKDYLQLRSESYGEEGELVNTMQASEIKQLGGRIFPTRMDMIPADKKGNKTVLIYKSMVFDNPIQDDFFSTQNIKKVK